MTFNFPSLDNVSSLITHLFAQLCWSFHDDIQATKQQQQSKDAWRMSNPLLAKKDLVEFFLERNSIKIGTMDER
jgi:hypothetical protein